jgi:hypothetical protein
MSEMVISTERPKWRTASPLSELRMTIQRTAVRRCLTYNVNADTVRTRDFLEMAI